MDKSELLKEIKMPYNELSSYLIKKYGPAKYDYFVTPECKTKSKKVSRSLEGLYCHHIDEDKGINLTNKSHAVRWPFEWQRKERLVYCNAIEHLLLHMKIDVMRQNREMKRPLDINFFFTSGGVHMVCRTINGLFMGNKPVNDWRAKCFSEIKENYNDYICVVRAFILYIEKAYKGEKNRSKILTTLTTGSHVRFSKGEYEIIEITENHGPASGSCAAFAGCDCEIVNISEKKDYFTLRSPSGEEKCFSIGTLIGRFTYADYLDYQFREMASGFSGAFYKQIYDDFINCPVDIIIDEYSEALKVDFSKEEFLWGHSFKEKLRNEGL